VKLTITIESSTTADDTQFGEVRLLPRTSGLAPQHLPVGFKFEQGDVTLTQTCLEPSIFLGEETDCSVTATNNTFEDAEVDLRTSVNNRLRIVDVDGAVQTGNRSAELLDQTLAAAKLGVPSVDPGELFGYIPLDAFGITPIAIGDEDILNFGVPVFAYNGVEYNSIGVDSNGYVLAGGGSSEDNNCCELPDGPSPAAPNNMLAPFWTDLDGTGAPGILIGVLTDGVDSWIVVEYRVNVFGTTSRRTFQVWIGVNGTQDITFAYPGPLADPAGQDFLVGAENDNGEGDVFATLPTQDLRVTSTEPEPGGSVSYGYTVRGVNPGVGIARTEMTTPLVPGVTVARTVIDVLPT
jgi:hypothetical protein